MRIHTRTIRPPQFAPQIVAMGLGAVRCDGQDVGVTLVVIGRVCPRCQAEKPLGDFYMGGEDHYCKPCRRAQVAEANARPAARARRAAANAAYRRLPENAERIREIQRKSYQKNFVSAKTKMACPICLDSFMGRSNQKVCSDCQRDWESRRTYIRWGLTQELYGEWKRAGVCHICGEVSAGKMSIDHCETTGRLGYSHQRCNLGIAQAHHDVRVLRRWISYLEGHVQQG